MSITGQPLLLCVTPNPAVDRTMIVPGFRAGRVWRAVRAMVDCGGSGVNAARAAGRLGYGAIAAGLLGGSTGRFAAVLAEREGLHCAWTPFDGETRTRVIIVDPEDPEPTVIDAPGAPINATDWHHLAARVLDCAAQVDAVGLCGSLPPGCPPGALSGLIRGLTDHGRTVWVDTGGPALAEAVGARPDGVKTDSAEAGALLGRPIRDIGDALGAAAALRQRGAGMAAVTLGPAGAVLVTAAGAWHVRPPMLTTVSPVGSGDVFLAALLGVLAGGDSPPEALILATAAGAANALQPGAGQIELADVERVLGDCRIQECQPS